MLHLLLMQPTVPQDSSHRNSAEQQNKKAQACHLGYLDVSQQLFLWHSCHELPI
jgi:hypothetical protein